MKKLLLHLCCAPCSVHVIDLLREKFNIIGFFFNPNIHPISEYQMRVNELRRISSHLEVSVIEGEYSKEEWTTLIKGYEKEKEGGKRCHICYTMRLNRCAEYAKDNDIDTFATVLTISPYKKAKIINTIGNEIAALYKLNFLEADFKKKDGFKISVQKSKHLNLMRQNYCGCEYSK